MKYNGIIIYVFSYTITLYWLGQVTYNIYATTIVAMRCVKGGHSKPGPSPPFRTLGLSAVDHNMMLSVTKTAYIDTAAEAYMSDL